MVALGRQYLIGDFYLCASERSAWWLGLLEASGRVNPATFDADPSLRTLIDVVPYGLPDTPLPAPILSSRVSGPVLHLTIAWRCGVAACGPGWNP